MAGLKQIKVFSILKPHICNPKAAVRSQQVQHVHEYVTRENVPQHNARYSSTHERIPAQIQIRSMLTSQPKLGPSPQHTIRLRVSFPLT